MPTRSNPDWRQLIDHSLRLREGPDRRSIGLNLPRDHYNLVLTAARARGGISLASYVRRSTLAVVRYDLDLDWADLTADETRARPLDLTGKPFGADVGHGAGFGPWLIDEMREFKP